MHNGYRRNKYQIDNINDSKSENNYDSHNMSVHAGHDFVLDYDPIDFTNGRK